ncbi:MAG: enoyl-CoA hydratase [Jiangellales bacterium]
MTDLVSVARHGTTVEIELNRPAKKNALTSEMYAVLADAVEQAEADVSVRSVLISGAGSAFSAGNDLQDFLTGSMEDEPPVLRFLRALSSASVPLVAAIQGPAVGIGATMLLHSEHVVAADDAVLQFPFVNMALVPEAGSSLLLPRVTGYLRAAEILLTGQKLDARRALDLGLVSRVVPVGEQVRAAREFTDGLAGQPPAAVRLTKRLLRDDTAGLDARIGTELVLFKERLQSPEFVEAVTAFMQKRAPVFDAPQG